MKRVHMLSRSQYIYETRLQNDHSSKFVKIEHALEHVIHSVVNICLHYFENLNACKRAILTRLLTNCGAPFSFTVKMRPLFLLDIVL